MTTDALILAYRTAYLELLERIKRLDPNSGTAAYERSILRELGRILDELDAKALEWAREAIPAAYLEGMGSSLAELRALEQPVPAAPNLTLLHRQAVAVLVENATAELLEAHRMVGRRMRDRLREVGLEAVTRKLTQGRTISQTARDLKERLAAEGFTGVVDSRGRNIRLDYYAETVARSTTAEATNRGTLNQLTELGYDLVKITEHRNPCPICARYQGRVYSITGKNPRYPRLFGTAFGEYANIHPRCRHRLAPYLPHLADDPEGDLERSNRPFEDDRSERERRAYERGQKQRAEVRAARALWERYKAAGLKVPPFASFVRMRREGTAGYERLKAEYRALGQEGRDA